MGKKAKWAILGVAVVGIGSTLAMSAAKRGNKATEVRMENVAKRDLVASVTASGQVRPQTKVDVASDVSGKIIKLAVREGQMVKAGDFLLQIDQEQPQAAVQRAEAALASMRAQLAQSQANLDQSVRTYDRTAQMKKANPTLIADEQVETLRTSVDVNKAVVEAQKHSIEQAAASLNDAKSALSKTMLYAPMSGRVGRAHPWLHAIIRGLRIRAPGDERRVGWGNFGGAEADAHHVAAAFFAKRHFVAP